MTITLWSGPFQLFSTSSGPITGVVWGQSRFDQTSDPVVLDAETPSATYVSGGLNDYTIDLTAQNWDGDQQSATLQLATTGMISLPFQYAAGTVFTADESGGVDTGAALWWSATATAGVYDIDFENYTDNVNLVSGATPALTPSGNVVTLESGVADPTGWAFAAGPSDLVLLYGTSASSTTKNLNVQIFSDTGQALTSSVVAKSAIPLSTDDSIFYSSATGSFILVQTATVDGAPGMEFTPIDTSTGALGTPVYQAFPQPTLLVGTGPITISSYSLVPLTNGDILEFIAWQNLSSGVGEQGISTQLLNSSFTDITASTSAFQSDGEDNIGQVTSWHWATARLANGDTVLVYAENDSVNILTFNSSGNISGRSLLEYGYAGEDVPTDFDSVVAMGSRFEITFQVYNISTGLEDEYAIIYDTATGGESFTINDANDPTGQYVGTPFNDTVTFGAGVNEINGGGGTDTFVATNFTPSQVSIVVDAQGNVVLSEGQGDVDTLERFTTITLSGATITINGDVLTQQNADGSQSVATFSAGALQSESFYSAAGAIVLSYTNNGVSVATFLENQSILDTVPGGIVIADTAANLAANANVLSADAHVISLISVPNDGAPTIAAPVSGGATTSEEPTISGAGVNVDVVSVTIDGTAAGTALVTAGVWSFTPAAPLSNGQHVVSATQAAAGGPTSSAATETFTVAAPVAAPMITGTKSTETTMKQAPLDPFAGITIADSNVDATDMLTITLSGGGGMLAGTDLASSNGVYTLAGTPAAITTALDALVFTPNAGSSGSASATNFTLSDLSSAYATPTVDATTSLVNVDPAGSTVHANNIALSGGVTGPYNFIDLLNLEASYGDLISAFGTNEQAMQNWYNAREPIEQRPDTFDGLDYVASYSDLIAAFKGAGSEQAVLDAGATHFITYGVNEGRATTFNGLDYIASYGDLIKAFGVNGDAGALHYIEYGASEGRTTTFDGLDYIASYGDLIKAFGANEQAGAAHFIQYGYSEGRATTFDGLDYIAGYTDLMKAFGANNDAGATHYIDYGLGEGRNADAFNVAAYESAHTDLIGKYANDDAFLTAYIDTYTTTGKFLT